jgi:hypothetical protein
LTNAPVVGESITIEGFLVELEVDDDELEPNCDSLGSRASQLATITTPVASAARRKRFDRIDITPAPITDVQSRAVLSARRR